MTQQNEILVSSDGVSRGAACSRPSPTPARASRSLRGGLRQRPRVCRGGLARQHFGNSQNEVLLSTDRGASRTPGGSSSLPQPAGSGSTTFAVAQRLAGVTCPTSSTCVAVGFYQSQSTVTDQNEVLVSEYGGVTWAQALGSGHDRCPALREHRRPGTLRGQPPGCRRLRRGGTRHGERQRSPGGRDPPERRRRPPSRSPRVRTISCGVSRVPPAARRCRRRVGQRLLPLSEPDPHERERATWTSVAVPEPAGATTQQLVGASRPTASACVAVGADDSQNEVLHTMGPAALTGVTLSAGVAGDLVILSGSGFGSAPGSVGFTPVARRRPSKSPHFGGSSSSPKRRVTDE